MLGHMKRWWDHAACRGMDTTEFFRHESRSGHARIPAWIAELCAGCPVADDCLADALDTPPNVDQGIRAGTTTRQRLRLRRVSNAAS
jgi:hypothetical protein